MLLHSSPSRFLCEQMQALEALAGGQYVKLQTALSRKPLLTPVRVKMPSLKTKSSKKKSKKAKRTKLNKSHAKKKGDIVAESKNQSASAPSSDFKGPQEEEGVVVGAVEVTEWMTLADCRELLFKELDEVRDIDRLSRFLLHL